MEISACVKYVGVNDHQVDLFEGQYKVPNGMSYNSYVRIYGAMCAVIREDGDILSDGYSVFQRNLQYLWQRHHSMLEHT